MVIDRLTIADTMRQATVWPLGHALPFLPPYSAAVGRSWGVALPGNGCAAGSRRSDQSAYPNQAIANPTGTANSRSYGCWITEDRRRGNSAPNASRPPAQRGRMPARNVA